MTDETKKPRSFSRNDLVKRFSRCYCHMCQSRALAIVPGILDKNTIRELNEYPTSFVLVCDWCGSMSQHNLDIRSSLKSQHLLKLSDELKLEENQ